MTQTLLMVLLSGGIGFVIGYYLRGKDEERWKSLFKEVLYLSLKGWKCVAGHTAFSPIYWQSPDEDDIRPQYEAVKRQEKLDEHNYWNIPIEKYEAGLWIED